VNTPTPLGAVVQALAGQSDAQFFAAVGRLRLDGRLQGSAAARFVMLVAQALEASASLAARRRADRLTRVIQCLQLGADGHAALANLAATLSPSLKNAVAGELPAAERLRLQRRHAGDLSVSGTDMEMPIVSANSISNRTDHLMAMPGGRAMDADAAEAGAGTQAEITSQGQHEETREVGRTQPLETLTADSEPPVAAAAPNEASRAVPGEGSGAAPPTGGGRSVAADDSEDAGDGADFSVVLLLSKPEHQESNKHLLQTNGFAPFVWGTVQQVRAELESHSDVCACCVDRTFLRDLDRAAQRELFEMLGRYSSLIFIRVDEDGLLLSNADLRETLCWVRCLPELPATALQQRTDSLIRDRELEEFRRARDLLRSYEGAQLVPDELRSHEVHLIVAAARVHAQQLTGREVPLPISVTTRFMTGGYSEGRVVLARLASNHQPVVMKVARKDAILDELRRFQSFVAPHDNELRPQPYFHGQAALLLFGLVPRAEDHGRPADMMDDALESLWKDQLFPPPGTTAADLERRAQNLGDALVATAARLQAMNVRTPEDSDLACYANPRPVTADRAERNGVDAGLGESAILARHRADRRMERLAKAGVVHGDLHLGNILVSGDRVPHLIDYAGSGPGHPAIDLVRLEVALVTGPLRQLLSGEDCTAFQQRLSLDLAGEVVLQAQFGGLYTCHVNRACLRGCLAARDAAIAAVHAHGGDVEDYLALKYLVAWQVLHMAKKQSGMARAIIRALAPAVNAWPAGPLAGADTLRLSDQVPVVSG
jgi:hypothetical protein